MSLWYGRVNAGQVALVAVELIQGERTGDDEAEWQKHENMSGQ